MAMLKKIHKKSDIKRSGTAEGQAAGYGREAEAWEELTPLDIIKEDTDVFSEEATAIFTLPAPSMDISDYYAYFLVPSEEIKAQSVRPIQ